MSGVTGDVISINERGSNVLGENVIDSKLKGDIPKMVW